jgi:hypothetical protein
MVGALAAVMLAGCHHRPQLVWNARGETTVDTSREFRMNGDSVIQSGKCPNSSFRILPPRTMSQGLLSFLQRSSYCTASVAESHDEQRVLLPAGSGVAYGSDIAVFANPWLVNYRDSVAFERDWVNVAIIDVGSPPSASLAALPVLLKLGRNCLFIHYDATGSIGTWQAAMVSDSVTCIPEGGAAYPKTAQMLPVASYRPYADADSYPPDVRIHEGTGNVTFIGTRCGNIWCVVGTRDTLDVSRPAKEENPPNGAPSSRWRVRGWYDDQRLADYPANSSGGLSPSDERGTIVPVDGLKDIPIEKYLSADLKDWPMVATIYIGVAGQLPKKYHDVYGLHKGPNKMWLGAKITTLSGKVDTVWSARIGERPEIPGLPTLPVDHEGHPGYIVPGTARWGWDEKDEQMWVACMVGCCMVKPDNRYLAASQPTSRPR